MKYIFLILLLFIPIASAQNDFKISLIPHYYLDGNESIYSPSLNFTQISFDILGQNTNLVYSISNFSIKIATPAEFKKSIPNESLVLGAGETKTLWKSYPINFTNSSGQNISFVLYVSGNEKDGKDVYAGDSVTIIFPKVIPKDKRPILEKIGDLAWQDNPYAGIWTLVIFIIVFSFFYWKNDGWGITADINNWWNKLFGKDEREAKEWWRQNVGGDIERAKQWKAIEDRRRMERESAEERW